jgi:hypothetical protein
MVSMCAGQSAPRAKAEVEWTWPNPAVSQGERCSPVGVTKDNVRAWIGEGQARPPRQPTLEFPVSEIDRWMRDGEAAQSSHRGWRVTIRPERATSEAVNSA